MGEKRSGKKWKGNRWRPKEAFEVLVDIGGGGRRKAGGEPFEKKRGTTERDWDKMQKVQARRSGKKKKAIAPRNYEGGKGSKGKEPPRAD